MATTVTQALQGLASDLHITVPPNGTQLVLTGSPYSIRLAKSLIDRLDVEQKLVVLDTEILEVDENAAKNLGLSFGVPPSGDEGVVSVNVEEIAGTPKLRPRFLAAFSSTSRISVSSTTSFCSTSSRSISDFASRIEYGLPVSTSCVPFGGTVMWRSEARPCSACVTVVAMSVADDDGDAGAAGSRLRSPHHGPAE